MVRTASEVANYVSRFEQIVKDPHKVCNLFSAQSISALRHKSTEKHGAKLVAASICFVEPIWVVGY